MLCNNDSQTRTIIYWYYNIILDDDGIAIKYYFSFYLCSQLKKNNKTVHTNFSSLFVIHFKQQDIDTYFQ